MAFNVVDLAIKNAIRKSRYNFLIGDRGLYTFNEIIKKEIEELTNEILKTAEQQNYQKKYIGPVIVEEVLNKKLNGRNP